MGRRLVEGRVMGSRVALGVLVGSCRVGSW